MPAGFGKSAILYDTEKIPGRLAGDCLGCGTFKSILYMTRCNVCLNKHAKYYSIPFNRVKFNFYTYFIAIHILLRQPEQTKIERRVYFGIERFPKSIYRNPDSKENKEYKKENVFVFDCYIFTKHKLLQSETPNRDSN